MAILIGFLAMSAVCALGFCVGHRLGEHAGEQKARYREILLHEILSGRALEEVARPGDGLPDPEMKVLAAAKTEQVSLAQ
jgi:hypothetical protein